MNTTLNSFVVLSAAVLALLSIFGGAIAVASSVVYRCTLLRNEVATRRTLGARRSNIVRMFLSENVLGIAAGILIGGFAVLAPGNLVGPGHWTVVLSSAALLIVAGLTGGWIAGRYAARKAVSTRTCFRTATDRRGQ